MSSFAGYVCALSFYITLRSRISLSRRFWTRRRSFCLRCESEKVCFWGGLCFVLLPRGRGGGGGFPFAWLLWKYGVSEIDSFDDEDDNEQRLLSSQVYVTCAAPQVWSVTWTYVNNPFGYLFFFHPAQGGRRLVHESLLSICLSIFPN